MRVLKLLKLYRNFSTLYGLMEDAKMKKTLWKSRTFWFQILSVAAAISGAVPLPPEITATIVGVINVALRLVTDKPVAVV
jgi:hypothetical protein